MKSNVLLIGGAGSGKTTSLRTIIQHVPRLFILTTENGLEHVLYKEPFRPEWREKVHFHYLPPAKVSWDVLREGAKQINLLGVDKLQKLPGIKKQDYDQFLQLIDDCANFPCDHCGQKFGPVDEFPEADCFVIDGLTGLSTMSMDLVVGSKPAKTQPEWGTAMDNLERFVSMTTDNLKCHFVLIGHLAREHDELTGGTNLTVSTLGQKLAPKLPPKFDEVVLALRSGTSFTWSTAAVNVDLKTRRLPIQDGLRPDFSQILAR